VADDPSTVYLVWDYDASDNPDFIGVYSERDDAEQVADEGGRYEDGSRWRYVNSVIYHNRRR
jgi:hypothetical protein